MSERRRSLFVLLIVLGLIAGSIYVVSKKDTKLGLDLQGGVQLIYEGQPTAQQPTVTQRGAAALAGHHARARRRLRRRRARAAAVRRQPDRGQPARASRTPSARRSRSAPPPSCSSTTGKPTSSTRTARRTRTRTPTTGTAITGFYNAVKQASKCDAQADGNNNAADAPRFYAFNKETKQPLNNGAAVGVATRPRSRTSRAEERANAEVLEVPEGILVVRDQKPSAEAPEPDRYWVIQDNPALSGTDIKNPEQNFDETRQPVVTFNFTDKGREAFQEITARDRPARRRQRAADRQPAERVPALRDRARRRAGLGAVHQLPREPGRASTARRAPRSPAASRSRRPRTSRGSSRSARCRSGSSWSRARRSPPRSAPRRSTRACVAGAAGFAIVALFLIVFYRVLGLIAVAAMCIYALYFYAVVKLIPIVLTLPGIAGLILTLGVAADANIVIFERVKEEMRGGQIGRPGDLRGLQEGPDGDHGREHRHGPGRLHPVRARVGGRPGLRAHARPSA